MTFPQPFADYEILDRIGSGAMGTVFKARHKRLNRLVALKVLRPSLARNERYVERLRREARIVAALNHPNIVAGYDLGSEGGYHYFVMEYVEGQSLRQILAEWGMFPPDRVLDIALQITAALDHAYRRGVIHRDIKPGNILLDSQQTVKLTDMGLAKGPTDLTITRHGATVGTPQYISPEQAADPQSADVRSDLYSLGATLFHMATGSPPFTGDTMAQVIGKVMHERAPSARDLNPDVGDGLDLVIRKLLAKDPSLRYQTPAELLEDLRRVRREEAPRVDPRVLDDEDPARLRRGRRWLWGGAAVAVTVATVTSLAVLLSSGDGQSSSSTADSATWLTRLSRADGLHGRVAVLQQATTGDVDAATLAELRSQIEAELRGVVDDFARSWSLGARRDTAEQWFADVENWRQPERFFEQVLPMAFEQQVGVAPSAMPPAARSHWQLRITDLRSRAEQWMQTRDAGFLRRFGDWLQDAVPRAWRGQLEDRDFVAAAAAVRKRIDDFFGADGMPTRNQLPDALEKRVAAMEQQAVEQAMAVIDAEEAQAAADVQGHVERALADLREKREVERLPAGRLLGLLERLRQELAAYPPMQSFHGVRDPWRRVQGQLAAFQRELEGDLLLDEAAEVDRAVERAYATLLELGDASLAAAWLPLESLQLAESRSIRDRHRALLTAAAAMAEQVCQAALDGREERVLTVRRAGNAGSVPIQVRLTRDGGCRLQMVGEARALPLSQIYWPDLLGAAGGLPPDTSADERAGVALWLYLTGDESGSLQLLEDDWRSFFARHVTDAVDRVRQTREDLDLPTLDRLAELRRVWASEPRDVEALRRALAAMTAGEDADRAEQPLVREARSWLQAYDARQHLQASVASSAPPGAAVDVDEQERITITWQPAADVLPSSWEATAAGARFVGEEVPLDRARADLALGFSSPVPDAHDVSLILQLRFPPVAGRHLLYLIEVHGAVVALGVLRDGAVVAAVESTAVLEQPMSLRRAMERALAHGDAAEPQRIVTGAEHVVTVRVLQGETRARVVVSLDGEALARGQVSRPSRLPMRVRLLPLQPLQLDAFSVQATP